LQRFQELLAEFAPDAAAGIESQLGYLHRGFVWRSSPEGGGGRRRRPEGAPPSTPSTHSPSAKGARDSGGRVEEVEVVAPSAGEDAGTSSLGGGAIALVPYNELLHRFHTRRRAVRLRAGRAMDTFLDFAEGDYVVHAEHGIARFAGLK